jgi:hypothetical protein
MFNESCHITDHDQVWTDAQAIDTDSVRAAVDMRGLFAIGIR